MTHTRNKQKSMKKHLRMLAVILVSMGAFILGVSAPQVRAQGEEPFDEAKLYFELNDTDGDLGIHGLIDGEPWDWLGIEDPSENHLLDVEVTGNLQQQGLTEFFFESAEPNFTELPPPDFFSRFPQGQYEIEGMTIEGDELESIVSLRHRMPAPAVVMVNNHRIIPSGDCDDDFEPTEVNLPVIIEWNRVTRSHPSIGRPTNASITAVLYQVVVEWEDEDENVFVFNAEFPDPGPTVQEMSVRVPDEFLLAAGENEFKVEVLVRADNFNQTAVESCPYVLVEDVTRAQMAVFLGRGIHGSSFNPPPAIGIFDDVAVSYWAAAWIEQLYKDGITTGCSKNPLKYCPAADVTRAQMAIFLLRSKHGESYKPPKATGIFSDVSVTYWAADWIEQLYKEGITTGCQKNPLRYCPESSVTHAQMAVFIARTFGH